MPLFSEAVLGDESQAERPDTDATNTLISTHPNFITYDKKKLLAHQDHHIRELAKKLP